MNVFFTIVSFLLLWSVNRAAAQNQTTRRQQLDELVSSENAFAKQATDFNTRKAFLDAIDSSSVMFSGNQSVNGYQLWQGRKENPDDLLYWFPAVAGVSASGELGYTIGPSIFKQKRDDPGPVYYGYYFSIWKRDRSGKFKVLVDAGTSRPKPGGADIMVEKQLTDGGPVAGRAAGKATGTKANLLEAEKRLNELALTQPGKAYRAYLANEVWLLREGMPVGKNKADALRMVSGSKVQSYGFTSKGNGIARSNDLAYTYGEALVTYREAEGGEKKRPGYYVRAWQYSGKDWQIIGELVGHQ
jgi:ketosteroid isomerase-like protein